MDVPPLRRPRRLVHRGRRRPRPDPPQRPARLGRPGRRGPGHAAPPTSATPTSRSAAASCRPILAEQLEPALALAPDLVTIHGGGNDVLRPRVDLDALAAAYDEAIGRLVASGAQVVMFTVFDPGGSASTPRCAAGSRSSTSGSARSPTGTAPPSSTCGGCASRPRRGSWTPTGCTSTPPATSDMAIAGPRRPRRRPRRSSAPARAAPALAPARAAARERSLDPRVRRPVGPPPPHRPLLGRRRLAQAADAGPIGLPRRVGVTILRRRSIRAARM